MQNGFRIDGNYCCIEDISENQFRLIMWPDGQPAHPFIWSGDSREKVMQAALNECRGKLEQLYNPSGLLYLDELF